MFDSANRVPAVKFCPSWTLKPARDSTASKPQHDTSTRTNRRRSGTCRCRSEWLMLSLYKPLSLETIHFPPTISKLSVSQTAFLSHSDRAARCLNDNALRLERGGDFVAPGRKDGDDVGE